jgi:hypothetical protein
MFASGAISLSSGLNQPLRERSIPSQTRAMSILKNIARIAEKATGWRKPDDLRSLLSERRPQIYRFKDDGVVPNHPLWPLIIYKSAVRLPECLDPAAVFEELFDSRGWGHSWRDGIYDYVHYHSSVHEVLGIARGSARVRFGGAKGRALNVSLRVRAINVSKRAKIFLSSGLTRRRAPMTNARH